jgi:hypothetical protein
MSTWLLAIANAYFIVVQPVFWVKSLVNQSAFPGNFDLAKVND